MSFPRKQTATTASPGAGRRASKLENRNSKFETRNMLQLRIMKDLFLESGATACRPGKGGQERGVGARRGLLLEGVFTRIDYRNLEYSSARSGQKNTVGAPGQKNVQECGSKPPCC